MTKYREILRLYSQGISQRSIAVSLDCSRNTVAKVLKRAKELNVTWPLRAETTDGDLEKIFFPGPVVQSSLSRRYPDVEYIHKELAKNNVTLRLLWTEYCGECRQSQELPFMYSQFCFYYQKFAETKRASMHIPRKPGEQLEVDWAGQTASIIDERHS